MRAKDKKYICNNTFCCRNGEGYLPEGYCDKVLCENRVPKKISQRMCLRDKTKVCDLCHDCDVDVLNPGNSIHTS